MTPKLKPKLRRCPCGKYPKLVATPFWMFRMRCDCGERGPCNRTEAEARASWNARQDGLSPRLAALLRNTKPVSELDLIRLGKAVNASGQKRGMR